MGVDSFGLGILVGVFGTISTIAAVLRLGCSWLWFLNMGEGREGIRCFPGVKRNRIRLLKRSFFAATGHIWRFHSVLLAATSKRCVFSKKSKAGSSL